MYVVIETPTEDMRLRIAKTDCVRRIKERIENRLESVPAASQILSTNGQVMADDDAVACKSFSLHEEARIQLTVKNMHLTVASPNGTKSTAVEVKPTAKVRILQKKLDFPLPSTSGYFFAHDGKALHDDHTIGGQGVKDGDTIQVTEDYFDYDKYDADHGGRGAKRRRRH